MSKEVQIAEDFIKRFCAKLREFGGDVDDLKNMGIFSNDAKLYMDEKCGFYGIVYLKDEQPISVETSWDEDDSMCRTEDIIGYTNVLIKTTLDDFYKEENGR